MYIISPLFVVILSALAGAGIMVYLNRRAYTLLLGGTIGAGAGAAAALITMTPLNYCTFEIEREPINIFLGFLIILAVMTAIISAAQWFVPRLMRRKSFKDIQDTSMGAYVGWVRINLIVALGILLFLISIALIFVNVTKVENGVLIQIAARFLPIVAAGLFGINWLVRDYLPEHRTQKAKFLLEETVLFKPFIPMSLPVAFLFPTAFILLVFIYYPMFDTFTLATQLARLGAPRSRFICLDNFTRLIGDPDYLNSLGVSFFLAATVIFFAISFSLVLASMAYLPIKGARVYRTLLIWPYALSPVIAGSIFRLLFNPQAGVLNYVLGNTIGVKVLWLLDPYIAPWTIVMTSVWNIMGFNILFYIAGLQNIPKDLLEAASIDGANAFQRFFRITFPLLSPITFFLVVTNTTYAFFDSFGIIDFLTEGGPLNSTSTLMYEVFVVGVRSRDLGKAAAQSLILFLIVIGVTVIQFRLSRNRVTYGA